MSRSVVDTLLERGFVNQCSDEAAVRELLGTQRVTVYIGFDPSAASLHLGSLVPMMALKHLQRAGHRVVALVGGATGMIGDPSGRSEERSLLDPDQLEANVAGVHAQLQRFLDDEANPPVMLNNADWIGPMSLHRVAPRRGQALHRELHARQGLGPVAARRTSRGSPTPSSAT